MQCHFSKMFTVKHVTIVSILKYAEYVNVFVEECLDCVSASAYSRRCCEFEGVCSRLALYFMMPCQALGGSISLTPEESFCYNLQCLLRWDALFDLIVQPFTGCRMKFKVDFSAP